MTISNWNVSTSGDWSDTGDWSNGVPEGAGYEAVISQSGTYTVTVASDESYTVGALTLDDTDATLEIDGTLGLTNMTLSAGTITGAGTLTLSGGSATLASGTEITTANLNLSGAETASVNSGTAIVTSALSDAEGTTISIGSDAELALEGSGSSISGEITGAGELGLGTGLTTIESGAVLSVSYLYAESLTVAGNINYGGFFEEEGTTSTLTVDSGCTLTLEGGRSLSGEFYGANAGAGTLAIDGGSYLAEGATFTVSNLTLTNNASLELEAGQETYGGTLSISDASISLEDYILTLNGTATIQAGGDIEGSSLVLDGGDVTLEGGGGISTKTISLSNAAALNVNGSYSFEATFTESAGTNIEIGSGATATLTGSNSEFRGTITGAGTLLLDGGSDAMRGIVGVANWTLSDDVTATFGRDLSYAGVLIEDAGSTLALGGNDLTLTGSDSIIAGAITGTKAFTLDGGSQEFDSGATISTDHWNLTGKDAITVDGDLSFANTFSSGLGTKIAISSGDTLELAGNATMASQISGEGTLELLYGTDSINKGSSLDVGTLELANGASLTVDATIKDAGALSIDGTSSLSVDGSKAFNVGGAATGAGTFNIDANATLEFSGTVASSLTANFDGSDAVLKLNDLSAGFAATISGFAVGDTIDLMHHGANSAVLDGNELVVKHNATVVATLQLSGDYTGYTFETSSDGHSGTDITLIALPEGNSGLHIVANTFSPDWHLG